MLKSRFSREGSSDRRTPLLLAVVVLSGVLAGQAAAAEDTAPSTADAKGAAAQGGLPGIDALDEAMNERLGAALRAKGPKYQPRTHHLDEAGRPKFTNRLIFETSPYLLQHAHNPVDWHPWGEEAFAKAKKLGRPIFLSVGYSTCHWCHVMERESFEDIEVARFLNENFVAIKVDREERPDIDGVYMGAVNLMTGRGGWPMTVVMTPGKRPFFGGTYFPARKGDRGAHVGLLEILTKLRDRYRDDPDTVVEQAEEITNRLRRFASRGLSSDLPDASILREASRQLAANHDATWGGFGRAPKFPRSHTLEFLMRYHRRSGDSAAREQALRTLDRMAEGGLRDHVGGGFHRYSTDAKWLVPHFEKMLYDNALLAVSYLEAAQLTGAHRYGAIAREVLDYVLREMTAPEGGFYSATDADSRTPEGHDEEGWFFTWTPDEIEATVGPERAALLAQRHGVTAAGNFESRNILHGAVPVERVAADRKASVAEVEAELAAAHRLLYERRSKRPAPILDDKIITGWNGLMISALAQAGRILNEPQYAKAAEKAARFIWAELRHDGQLKRSFREGWARHDAVLDDYAYLAAGLLDLFETTSDLVWLERAIDLHDVLDREFSAPAGGFYFIGSNGEALLTRERTIYDGARPAGNSVATLNLLRLYELTLDEGYRQQAERAFVGFAGAISASPIGSPKMLAALDFFLDTPKEIVLVQPDEKADPEPFLAALRRTHLPNHVMVRAVHGAPLVTLGRRIPWAREKKVIDGKVTAYVCENQVCKLPTTDPKVFAKQIATTHPYPSEGDAKESEPSPTP